MKRTALAALGTAALLLALVAAGCSGPAGTRRAAAADPTPTTAPTTDRSTIVVHGHGTVEGTPNVMTISLGVQSAASTATDALHRNNDRADALIRALKGKGVADKDVQTASLSLGPTYDQHGHLTGYSASNVVTARLRDLGTAGEVVDAAVGAAGDDARLQGVSFSIDDTSSLVAQARADAVGQAVAHAHQLADAAKVRLGAIRTIDETGAEPPPLFNLQDRVANQAGTPVPIEPGAQQIGVDVTVVFEIAG